MSSRPSLSLRSILPNFMRRQQPPLSSPLPSPAPLTRYIVRPDTALPPTYDQTWDTVQNKDVWPLFIRANKSAFRRHATDKILNEPDWFRHLESHEYSASTVLWPNVVCVEPGSDYNNKHWSIKFLRYALEVGDNQVVTSEFACMIVCEVIFTILTPYPEDWPRGIDAISRLIGWTQTEIKNWFDTRRTFERRSPESLESHNEAKSIVYQSSAMDNTVRKRRHIRQDALYYLTCNGNIGRLHWDPDVFFSWLTNDLCLLTARCSGSRKYFPPSSYFAEG